MNPQLILLLVEMFGPIVARVLNMLLDVVAAQIATKADTPLDAVMSRNDFERSMMIQLALFNSDFPGLDPAERIGTMFARVQKLAARYGVEISDDAITHLVCAGEGIKPA